VPIGIYFGLAGVFLGLGFYSYAAARLFPLVYIVFVAYWFWRERVALKRYWRYMALMAGVALATALPILLFFARYPYYFVFRIAYVANKGKGAVEGQPWLTWGMNVWRVIRGLFIYGETHLRHNLPGRPFMDAIQATLFVAGGVVTVLQRHRLQWVFLWLWLSVMLLPSILSGDAPHFGRLLGAGPAIAVFAGIGWHGALTYLLQKSSGKRRRLVIGLLCLLLLVSVAWTTVDYFDRYGGQPELPEAFYRSDLELGRYLAGYDEETSLYLTPTQEELATIYFALEGPERLTNFTGREGLTPLGVPGRPTVYAVRPWTVDYLSELEQNVPGYVADQRDEFVTYLGLGEISVPGSIPNAMDASWAEVIDLVGWQHSLQEGQLAVTLFWQARSEMDVDYTAFVHVLNEQGEIITQNDRPPLGHSTSNWREGEIVSDVFILQLPDESEFARVTLRVGFYDPATLAVLGEPTILDSNLPAQVTE
jgi:hypothetical protein